MGPIIAPNIKTNIPSGSAPIAKSLHSGIIWTMTYSIDFRKKVFDYKDKHELTFEQVSEHFEVSMRSLFRWEKELEPATTKKRPALKVDMDMLKNDVKMLPDSYQWECIFR